MEQDIAVMKQDIVGLKETQAAMQQDIREMKENIAAVLDLSPARVNVGATTTEGLGMIGEGDGIAATANCILAVKR